MEIINPGDKPPIFEMTGEHRIITYGLYNATDGQYYLIKFFSTKASNHVYFDSEQSYKCSDGLWLHHQLAQQGFVWLEPNPSDDPKLIRTYL